MLLIIKINTKLRISLAVTGVKNREADTVAVQMTAKYSGR